MVTAKEKKGKQIVRNKILIYEDYGCADVSALEKGLRGYFEPRGCSVGFTDAAGIINGNELNDEVLAFFIPGGAGTPYRRKLEVLGNEKIREYVSDGGIYYGICAGAYYACRQTIFEADIPELKIISECGLNLVEGKAVGTLYKELGILPYAKNAESSAAVELLWNDGKIYTAHYHGGPFFEPDNQDESIILARYNFADKRPAVISKHFGKGKVILSGVHFENKGQDLLKAVHALRLDSQTARQVAEKLSDEEFSRQALFNKIMAVSGR